MPFRFLVACSETFEEQRERREAAGASAAESYAALLHRLEPLSRSVIVSCVEDDEDRSETLDGIDAVFFAGSPIQMHDQTPQTRRAAAFMREVFRAGVPTFGSCAGMQIAAVAAGGTVKPRSPRMEAGFARGIVATDAGRVHPLLRGRAVSWDALAMHSSEIDRLPEGAIVLAQTRTTPVQAIEIRHANGCFWGVQYHPELTPTEIATALRRNGKEIVSAGLAKNAADVENHSDRIAGLDRDADQGRGLVWMLGLDDELLDAGRRTLEIRNFVGSLPNRA